MDFLRQSIDARMHGLTGKWNGHEFKFNACKGGGGKNRHCCRICATWRDKAEKERERERYFQSQHSIGSRTHTHTQISAEALKWRVFWRWCMPTISSSPTSHLTQIASGNCNPQSP